MQLTHCGTENKAPSSQALASRGGVTRSKGLQAGTRTCGLCSMDKASVHGRPALPTKLNEAPVCSFYCVFSLFLFIKCTLRCD